MQWYVLQVLTGEEEDVAAQLRWRNIEALVPKEYVTLRKGGHWQDKPRLLLPGYVLIHVNYNASCYYTFRIILGIIRILGNDGKPLPLTPSEEAYWTQGDWQPSRVRFELDGTWTVLNGPLSRVPPSQIVKVSRRQRRARVRLDVSGVMNVIRDLAIIPV